MSLSRTLKFGGHWIGRQMDGWINGHWLLPETQSPQYTVLGLPKKEPELTMKSYMKFEFSDGNYTHNKLYIYTHTHPTPTYIHRYYL